MELHNKLPTQKMPTADAEAYRRQLSQRGPLNRGEGIVKARNYGSGYVEARGPGRWRLRYYVGGKRFSCMVDGTRMDAQRRLRELLSTADAGEHIVPSRLTLAAWVAHWLELLGRGEANGIRRRGLVSPRTRERYQELLEVYILPTLGERLLQKLTASEIDTVYMRLEPRLSPTTVRHVHTALRSCLATAVRKGMLPKNPADAADPPQSGSLRGRAGADVCGGHRADRWIFRLRLPANRRHRGDDRAKAGRALSAALERSRPGRQDAQH